jgi:GR25 family glycosyltransferase involved in LPS biosynthesis
LLILHKESFDFCDGTVSIESNNNQQELYNKIINKNLKMRLFDRFDKVYCINLDRRPDRLENFKKEVEKYNLGEFERFSAYDRDKIDLSKYSLSVNPGAIGLLLSNLEIILESQINNYKSILILEDDCVFTDEILNIDSYFEKLPSDWDLLYMGGNHNIHMMSEPPVKINDKVCKLHSTYTTHFVGINKSMFNIVEEYIRKFDSPIDVMYAALQQKYNVYSFYPAIAKQSEGFSDIEKIDINYDWLIK